MSRVLSRREWRVTWVDKETGDPWSTEFATKDDALFERDELKEEGERDVHVYSRVIAETAWEEET